MHSCLHAWWAKFSRVRLYSSEEVRQARCSSTINNNYPPTSYVFAESTCRRALIINIVDNPDEDKKRHGSNIDKEKLEATLKKLNYDVKVEVCSHGSGGYMGCISSE